MLDNYKGYKKLGVVEESPKPVSQDRNNERMEILDPKPQNFFIVQADNVDDLLGKLSNQGSAALKRQAESPLLNPNSKILFLTE